MVQDFGDEQPAPATDVAGWAPGQPAPEGFVVVPADDIEDEHLQHATLRPGAAPAARATATQPLVCVVSGEEIAAGEKYIDGGDVWDGVSYNADGSRQLHRYTVKQGHESEAYRLA